MFGISTSTLVTLCTLVLAQTLVIEAAPSGSFLALERREPVPGILKGAKRRFDKVKTGIQAGKLKRSGKHRDAALKQVDFLIKHISKSPGATKLITRTELKSKIEAILPAEGPFYAHYPSSKVVAACAATKVDSANEVKYLKYLGLSDKAKKDMVNMCVKEIDQGASGGGNGSETASGNEDDGPSYESSNLPAEVPADE